MSHSCQGALRPQSRDQGGLPSCSVQIPVLGLWGQIEDSSFDLLFSLLSCPFLGLLASALMGFQVTLLGSLSPFARATLVHTPWAPTPSVPRSHTPTGWHDACPSPNPATQLLALPLLTWPPHNLAPPSNCPRGETQMPFPELPGLLDQRALAITTAFFFGSALRSHQGPRALPDSQLLGWKLQPQPVCPSSTDDSSSQFSPVTCPSPCRDHKHLQA